MIAITDMRSLRFLFLKRANVLANFDIKLEMEMLKNQYIFLTFVLIMCITAASYRLCETHQTITSLSNRQCGHQFWINTKENQKLFLSMRPPLNAPILFSIPISWLLLLIVLLFYNMLRSTMWFIQSFTN